MEFHNYITHFQAIKKADPRLSREDVLSATLQSKDVHSQMIAEDMWEKANRPYYSIYPSMVRALSKVNLNAKCEHIIWPKDLGKFEPFTIRFPVGNDDSPVNEEGIRLQSILVSMSYKMEYNANGVSDNKLVYAGRASKTDTGLLIYPCFGTKYMNGVDLPYTYWLSFPLVSGISIEESLNKYVGPSEYHETLRKCLRYVIGVILISTNHEYTIPEVLSKHKSRYAETKDNSLIDKAKRNGKFGWTIGEELERESSTHVRIPHFSVRYTGPGGTVPTLTPIKGSIVNRHKFVAKREEDGLE